MSVLTKFTRILLVVSCLNVHLVLPSAPEPMCLSRFDYDAKLLERLIHLENKMKQLEEKSQADSETLQDERRALVDSVSSLSGELQESQTTATGEMKEKAQQLEAGVEAKLAEMENTLIQQDVAQKAFVDGVTTTLATVQSVVNSSLAKAADAKKPGAVFYVRSPGTSNPGTNALIKFGTALVNPGGLYDTETGFFTVKTGGLYLFSLQVCSYSNQYLNVRICINGDYVSDATSYGGDGAPCTTSIAVATLSPGDLVGVKTGPNTSISKKVLYYGGYRWCTFMGVLIQ